MRNRHIKWHLLHLLEGADENIILNLNILIKILVHVVEHSKVEGRKKLKVEGTDLVLVLFVTLRLRLGDPNLEEITIELKDV